MCGWCPQPPLAAEENADESVTSLRRRSRGNVAPLRVGRVRMEHEHGPIEVEWFAMPVWRGGVGVDRDAVRPNEPGVSVSAQFDDNSLFVHRTVVTPTQQDQIVEPGGTTVSPVADVVCVTPPRVATGKATAVVSRAQRTANRRRNRAGLAPHVEHLPIPVVPHDHRRCVATVTAAWCTDRGRRETGCPEAVKEKAKQNQDFRGVAPDHNRLTDWVAEPPRPPRWTCARKRAQSRGLRRPRTSAP